MAKNIVKAMEMQDVDVSTIGAGGWTAFNTAGLDGACFFLRFTNDSNTDVIISFDGVTDHEFIHSYTDISINFQTNSSPSNYVSKMPKGTVVYVRGVTGVGDIWLSGYYNG